MRALLAVLLTLVVVPRVAGAQAQNPPPPVIVEGSVQANVAAPQVGQPVAMQQPVIAPQPVMAPQPTVSVQPLMDGQPAPIQVNGPVSLACPLTPCQLPLVPGTYNFTVMGSGGFSRSFVLPGVPALIGYRQRQTGRLVVGIIELAIGAPVALTGLVLTGYGLVWFFGSSSSLGVGIGVVLLAGGIVGLAVGIPLTIVGALNIARSGPQLDVRPGGMMGALRGRGRNRAWLTPTSGIMGDGYAGGVLNTVGFAF